MDTPSSDFEELLGFLNARAVEALIVGGHALAFHGHPRFTKDLDVFVRPDSNNAARLLEALDDFGFGGVGLTIDDFLRPNSIIQLGVSPNRVDLMNAIDGVGFDEAWQNRQRGAFGSVPVFYLGREDFIRNKRASNRAQDLADIEALDG